MAVTLIAIDDTCEWEIFTGDTLLTMFASSCKKVMSGLT